MKMNKKLIVPFLSTIIGLSIAGGLGGAFAWYQFNSTVTTAFIGQSVADTGLLQIGYMDSSSDMHWGKEYVLADTNLIPVTFGQLNTDGSLRSTAYGYPEAGKQSGSDYTSGWTPIQQGKGFYQYDIYLRALKADSQATGDASQQINPGYKLVEKDVYISNLVLEGVDDNTNGTLITNAMRLHLDVKDGTKTLVSNKAVTNLALSGQLDLDGNGLVDTYDVMPWESGYGDPVMYGITGETQTTKAISDVVETPDPTTGLYPSTATAKKICTTKTGAEMVKITVTVWLEGWALLKNKADSDDLSAVWNPAMNSGMKVHAGIVFDAGRNLIG